jgi:hypothetical protein
MKGQGLCRRKDSGLSIYGDHGQTSLDEILPL